VIRESDSITWLILAGRKRRGPDPVEWVEETKMKLVSDVIAKLKNISLIDRIIVSSNDQDFLDRVKSEDPRVIPDYFIVNGSFNFGAKLVEIIEKFRIHNLFYWGGGASPLITAEILESLCTSIVSGDSILYTNNFFSADWVAFTPAKAALEINPPALDNNLAYALWKERGIRSIYIEPTVEIIGDVDTPADLLILKEIPQVGISTRDYLSKLPLNTERVKKMIDLLQDRNRIFLSGRVGSSLFRYLDTRCSCSFRIISEERGMRSFGRVERKEVKSIIGKMFEEMGLDSTFSFIESANHGAIMDSRVPFAHIRGSVKTEDRFFSDLGIYEEVRDPWVKNFTKRVIESPIPILTGGHSLISGGLWALVSSFGELPNFY
jgi:hypothetical protein